MGDILYKKHRPEEAFAAYDSCLQWKDDNVMALNNYAYYLSEERRDLKKAEQMSQKTVKAEPTNSTYLDTYAWILFLQGVMTRHEPISTVHLPAMTTLQRTPPTDPRRLLWNTPATYTASVATRNAPLNYGSKP